MQDLLLRALIDGARNLLGFVEARYSRPEAILGEGVPKGTVNETAGRRPWTEFEQYEFDRLDKELSALERRCFPASPVPSVECEDIFSPVQVDPVTRGDSRLVYRFELPNGQKARNEDEYARQRFFVEELENETWRKRLEDLIETATAALRLYVDEPTLTFEANGLVFHFNGKVGNFELPRVGWYVAELVRRKGKPLSIPHAVKADDRLESLRPRDMEDLPPPFDQAIVSCGNGGFYFDASELHPSK